MRRLRRPDFIIIGAQKCGTTTLFQYLSAHPDIGMHTYCYPGASNETHYFTHLAETKSLEWYMAGFPAEARFVGEKDPGYHVKPEVIARIHALFPETKLIFLVRCPVRRLISQVTMRQKRIPGLTIKDVLDDETYHREYLYRGCYYDQLMAMPPTARSRTLVSVVDGDYSLGDRTRLEKVNGVHGFAAPSSEMGQAYTDVCTFLGIEPVPVKDARHYNIARRHIHVTDEEITRAASFYAEGNARLEDFLGRSLPWMGP